MQANAQRWKMYTKLLVFHALIALTLADVSHISREYLPPVAENKYLTHIQQTEPQQQQKQYKYQHVQHDAVLSDEAANGNALASIDVRESNDGTDSKSASDPFIQPGLGSFPSVAPTYPGQGFAYPGYPGQGFSGAGFPGAGFLGQFFPGSGFPYPGYPGQFPGQGFAGQGFPGAGFSGAGFTGQGFPGQGLPGQGFPGQGFPGQGLPGQGFSGQGFPGQGFSGQGFPGQGFPGQGFPPQAGGFSGVPYQTASQQQPSGSNAPPTSGYNERVQTARIASDTIYDANGGYVYDKPK
ncbi:pro-resilin [Rhagoletis pomonella]|uniref:pro-resilin n=1 Tax=Rhagoletis pomonella TaxID=28610 RepID=UPI00177B3153|nr:pro-resilin [Rhagoletis pomonella]